MSNAIKDALQWLETCINCPAWHWDPQQREAAQLALDAAREEQLPPPYKIENVDAAEVAKLVAFFRSPEGDAMRRAGDVAEWTPAECAIWHLKHSIPLTPAEIQSGCTRLQWAEGLIRQLPDTHDGRNSWLLNYAREPYTTHGAPYKHERPQGPVGTEGSV